jgi:hypothetical protein
MDDIITFERYGNGHLKLSPIFDADCQENTLVTFPADPQYWYIYDSREISVFDEHGITQGFLFKQVLFGTVSAMRNNDMRKTLNKAPFICLKNPITNSSITKIQAEPEMEFFEELKTYSTSEFIIGINIIRRLILGLGLVSETSDNRNTGTINVCQPKLLLLHV